MSKQIFKGFKQVTAAQFNAAKESNTLAGYLWFVRTEVKTDSETDTNDVSNDEYDIYFGSKKYGHFCEGELQGIKDSISKLGDDIESITEALNEMTELIATSAESIAENAGNIQKNSGDIAGIQSELKGFLVKNIDTNDKVINVADGILTSTLNLTYSNNRISLKGKNDVEIAGFDASDFVKDSVLENVEVQDKEDGEKYIVFTWKTEGETTKTDEIKVSDFAKLYEAGTALSLDTDGVTFNVKIAENNNFLTVNESNELVVDDITTDKTMLKEAITIEGGPLATDAVKSAFKDGIIPVGTDIQSVLKALLCVEIYPKPTANTPTYSVSITAPSITAKNVSNNALVEVGQKITFNTVTATSVSISKTQPIVSGFTHGYQVSLDGDINTSTSISGKWTINQKTDNVYELSAETSGFTGNKPTTVQNADNTKCQLASCELTANLGTNTYSVTEDAPIHTGSYTGVDSVYVVSNLKGVSKEEKSPKIEASTVNVEQDPTNQTSTFTVTGVYPVYTNGVVASTNDAEAAAMANLSAPIEGDGTKLPLMKSGTAFAVSFASQSLAPYKLYLPGEWKITSAKTIDDFAKTYTVDCKEDFKSAGTKTIKVQNIDVTYTIYQWEATQGANRVKFTVA